METLNGTVEDVAWIAVENNAAIGRVSRAAADIARRLGFSAHRTGEVSIGATELATNLQRHAVAGTMLVRVRRCSHVGAVEILAVDGGPGVHDIAAISRDGYSTKGTLGVGVGAVMRLASSFDCHSVVGKGTVAVATFWADSPSTPRPAVDGLTRPFEGEEQCGDAWTFRVDGNRIAMLLVDGLGHGELAATAARTAVRTFETAPLTSASAMLAALNLALRSTRGAAGAVAIIDRDAASLRFAGIGNIGVWIDDGAVRKGVPSSPGIVGAYGKAVKELTLALPPQSLVIMHSDGLSSKWDLGAYPGLRGRDCLLIAATLLRDAGIHHDDASSVVARAS